MISKKTVIMLIILLLFLGIIYAPQKYFTVKSYAMSLHPDNTDPYGTSSFVNMLKKLGFRVIYGNTSQLKELGEEDLYVLIGPDKTLSQDEISEIESFLNRGGGLLVADELGVVNNLLEKLFGAEIDPNYVNETLSNLINEKNKTNSSGPIKVNNISIGQVAAPPAPPYNDLLSNNTSCWYIIDKAYNMTEDKDKFMFYTPNLPSYFKEVGNINISGVLFGLNTSSNEYTCLPFSVAYNGKHRGRAYILADTYLFTNYFLSRDGSPPFYEKLLNWLTKRNVNENNNYNNTSTVTTMVTVVIDIDHYEPVVIKRPLPRMGDIILGALNNIFNNIKDTYNDTVSRLPIEIILAGILISIVSLYFTFKTRIKIPSTKEREMPHVIEKESVGESIFLRKLRVGETSKEFYRDMIYGLYELFDYILKESISTEISEIYLKKIPENIATLFDDQEREVLLKTARRLYLLKKKIDEKRIVPLVISWRREFNKLSIGVDLISRKLGYVIMSMEEGKKKIEYIIR